MQIKSSEAIRIGRRAWIRDGSLFLAAIGASCSSLLRANEVPKVAYRWGLLTDLHFAEKDSAGTRFYRQTLTKVEEALAKFAELRIDGLVELGDLVDAASSPEKELGFLKQINDRLITAGKDRHYVLGNHCVSTLSKDQFLDGIERERSYYSFDREGFHFIILDACFRSDGVPYGKNNFQWTDANLPESQLEWLRGDLAQATRPTVVFVHQRLDVDNDHGIKNRADVRKILEASGKVSSVFQGHSHQNDYRELQGIHYVTLVAMVEGNGPENSGYSVLDCQSDGILKLTGFRRQKSMEWTIQEKAKVKP